MMEQQQDILPWDLHPPWQQLPTANGPVTPRSEDNPATQLSLCDPERAKGPDRKNSRRNLPSEPGKLVLNIMRVDLTYCAANNDWSATNQSTCSRTSPKQRSRTCTKTAASYRAKRSRAFREYKDNDSLWLDKVQISIDEEQCKLKQERIELEELGRRFPAISTSLSNMIVSNSRRSGRMAELQEFLEACGAKAKVATKVLERV